MPKGKDHDEQIMSLLQGQKELELDDARTGSSVEFVKTTREGFALFRKKEAHGGYSWWTDEIPVGYQVFDDGLDNVMNIAEVLEEQGTLPQWVDHLIETFDLNRK